MCTQRIVPAFLLGLGCAPTPILIAPEKPIERPGNEGDTGEGAETDGGDGTDGGAEGGGDTAPPEPIWPALVINEFVPDNASGFRDDAGDTPDWVELYNPTESDVDLGGWFLTDDLEEELERPFSAGLIVPAGGHLLLFADEGDGDDHLPFSLSGEGESLGLFGPDAYPVDRVVWTRVSADVGAARSPDGSETWIWGSATTPGATNP